MSHHLLSAACAAAFLLLAGIARADVVDITDGAKGLRLPKTVQSAWGSNPTDEEIQASGKKNLKLAYDAFELGGLRGDAAQVVRVYLAEVPRTATSRTARSTACPATGTRASRPSRRPPRT